MARIGAGAIAVGAHCASRSEAQKCKFVENCVRIDGKCVPVVAAAETAI